MIPFSAKEDFITFYNRDDIDDNDGTATSNEKIVVVIIINNLTSLELNINIRQCHKT